MIDASRPRSPRQIHPFARLLGAGLLVVAACGPAHHPERLHANARPAAAASALPAPAAAALPVEAATRPAAPAGVNPFAGTELYVNPAYALKVASTRAAHPDRSRELSELERAPTALWLDNIAAVAELPARLEEVVARAKSTGRSQLPVLVVYNLPNRDCSAKSSAGELSIDADGERRYRSEFIDPIAAAVAAHPDQRVAVILEPDSLANLVTNLGIPKCHVSQHVYASSVAYAISKLSMPHVFIYLDSAHAGWLGWDGNRTKMAEVVRQVLTMAGGLDRISGFATNVSNYTPLEGDDGRRLEPSNPCPNELSFVEKMSQAYAAKGMAGKGFVVDTGRNGRSGIRSRWGNWCNISGAGIGERPRAAPRPLVHAYFWVKPPGDSDGTSDPSAARFDENCRSPDAAPAAPEAGKWFDAYVLELVKNAQPPL